MIFFDYLYTILIYVGVSDSWECATRTIGEFLVVQCNALP